MHAALVATIVATAAVFGALLVLILANRIYRTIAGRWRRNRRQVLEPLVLEYAHGAGPSLKAVLGGASSRGDRGVLEEILLDHVQRVRGEEHARLGRAFDEAGLVDRRLSDLSARHWHRRAEAAEKLGLVRAARASDKLAETLEDVDSEVRLRAAKALGAIGGKPSLRLLIGALAQPTRWSTIRIADILAGMGADAADELIAAFPGLSPAAQLTALDILGQIRAPASGAWLVERLKDPAADTRARACHALGALADPGAGPAVTEALSDSEWPVRAMAAKALGRIGAGGAISGLTRALRDPQWWVRANAAEALRELGAPGLAALLKMLEDDDAYARDQCVRMVEEAGVLDRAVARLGGPAGPHRSAAETLVLCLVRAGQLGRLRELAGAHADPAVRAALGRLLPVEAAEARA